MDKTEHDVVVIGGGPIGCAVACALEGSGREVSVLEAQSAERRVPDARTLALSWGSRLVLERLGVWPACDAATPITSIHVSQRGHFGRAELTAREVDLPALGYVLPYSSLHDALLGRLRGSVNTELKYAVEVDDLFIADDSVTLSCKTDGSAQKLRARLVIIADGGTALGTKAGARIHVRDYHQSAVVALVNTSRPHGNRAFERFTGDGPVALLPRSVGFALVWSCAPECAPAIKSLDKVRFLAQLQSHFGDRAGTFLDVGERSSFALSLRFARNRVQSRVVLLGNSAQALHPIAGQGFNLGLRDAWELADAVLHAPGADPGNAWVLSRFQRQRVSDRLAGVAFTDALARLFSSDFAPLVAIAGIGLTLLDGFGPAKQFLMRRMIFGSRL